MLDDEIVREKKKKERDKKMNDLPHHQKKKVSIKIECL